MLLKIPCKTGDQVSTLLVNRDSINAVQSLDNGSACAIYINNIGTPLYAKVRFKTLESFLGRAFPEGSMKVPEAKEDPQDEKRG